MELKLTKKLLTSLLQFKETASPLQLDLLTQIVINQSEIDLDYLDTILYLDKPNNLPKEERIKNLKKELEKNFVWCFYKNFNFLIKEVNFKKKEEMNETGLWVLRDKEKSNEEEVIELLKKKQRGKRMKVKIRRSDEMNEEEINELIKEMAENKNLNEKKKKEKKIEEKPREESTPGPLFKFIKKVEKKETPHSFTPYRTLPHIRRRNDLISPKRITYINFTDRHRPPIYKIIPEKMYHIVDSTQRLPHITDYSYDSDDEWEDCEDADTISTTESSCSQDEEINDWLEPDSEIEDNSSKIIIRSDAKLFYVVLNTPDYSLSLRRKDFLSENEKEIIENEISNKKEIKKFIKEFADEKWVQVEVINNFIKEIQNKSTNDDLKENEKVNC
ncbi:hypothetical protein TUBRATIS_16140 [Tubulinosema ratisbonensis]|uniref:Chromatin assembly factor 1 subunit A dimerization domain-containing protein n=1 Tax=Tubulinosema ratisbonensis TaxID=291195 RepID=A0A437AL99_9MICR|nr:hypothetical protein TUBRATIS_16140 [Tubulinosema ratisbonensis]